MIEYFEINQVSFGNSLDIDLESLIIIEIMLIYQEMYFQMVVCVLIEIMLIYQEMYFQMLVCVLKKYIYKY